MPAGSSDDAGPQLSFAQVARVGIWAHPAKVSRTMANPIWALAIMTGDSLSRCGFIVRAEFVGALFFSAFTDSA
jgi:hypothetical protein